MSKLIERCRYCGKSPCSGSFEERREITPREFIRRVDPWWVKWRDNLKRSKSGAHP